MIVESSATGATVRVTEAAAAAGHPNHVGYYRRVNAGKPTWTIASFFLTAMAFGGAVLFGFLAVPAVSAVLAQVFVIKLALETKGRELEEIRHH